MKKLMRDPELEALVRELNDAGGAADSPPDDRISRVETPPLEVAEGNALEQLLIEVAQRGASDLHLVVGVPPVFRIGGRLAPSARMRGCHHHLNRGACAMRMLLMNFTLSS